VRRDSTSHVLFLFLATGFRTLLCGLAFGLIGSGLAATERVARRRLGVAGPAAISIDGFSGDTKVMESSEVGGLGEEASSYISASEVGLGGEDNGDWEPE
jgi:hypothetical protein